MPKNRTVYNNNLNALKKRYPDLYKQLIACPDDEQYVFCTSGKNSIPNILKIETKELYYDPENSQEEIRRQLDSFNLKNAKIALFLGFGLGFELDAFAKDYAEKALTRVILVVEKNIEMFKIALSHFDYRPLFKESKIHLVVGVPVEELLPFFSEFLTNDTRIFYSKAISPVYMDGALRFDRDYYQQVVKVFSSSVPYALRYFGNSPGDSLVGLENMLENIGEIIKNPGIDMLYDKFPKKPAIIVATGPSLNKNKHLLKGLEDKALIFAVDASLRILIDSGVKPHLVTSLERVKETTELMDGFKYEDVKDVYFTACPVIPNEAYKVYPGPRIISYRRFNHFKWIEIEKGTLDIKQSSSNMAFKIAEALGCDPIILIGQDLAYARTGQSHAVGTLYGEEQFQYKNAGNDDIKWVMGNDGELIKTHTDWDEFRKSYEVDIANYKGQCINATEGGAKIHGTSIMTFQEAIDQYLTTPFGPLGIIKDNLSSFSFKNGLSDLERVQEIVKKTKSDVNTIKEYCFDAVNTTLEDEEVFDAWLKNSAEEQTDPEFEAYAQKIADRLVETKVKILKIEPTMSLFVMHIFQSYLLKHEIDCHGLPSEYERGEEISIFTAKKHIQLFRVLHDLMNICQDYLSRAEATLESIRSEFDKQGI